MNALNQPKTGKIMHSRRHGHFKSVHVFLVLIHIVTSFLFVEKDSQNDLFHKKLNQLKNYELKMNDIFIKSKAKVKLL